jgi:hypothetical protein
MHYLSPQHSLKTHHQLSQDGFIFSAEVSIHFGITNDYITRLCRQKKIEGILLGRSWFVSKKSLEDYLQQTRIKRQEQRRVLSQQLRQEYQQRFLATKSV